LDTDNLSIPTYKGVILAANKFNRDLTLQFGVLASSCKDDDDYLNRAESLIKDWLNDDDMESLIGDIFYGEIVNEKKFTKTLNKILSNIHEIRKTLMEKLVYEYWR
jgi:hypothetical protein